MAVYRIEQMHIYDETWIQRKQRIEMRSTCSAQRMMCDVTCCILFSVMLHVIRLTKMLHFTHLAACLVCFAM